MADGRRKNGGHSTKPKRKNDKRLKSKAEEQALIEKLSPLEDEAFIQLEKAVKEGEQWAIKMFFEYMYGKPSQSVDVTSKGQQITLPPLVFADD